VNLIWQEMWEEMHEVKHHPEQNESSEKHVALPGAPVHAPATRGHGGWARMWQWPRRHRFLTAGVLFVLLISLFAWQLWLRNLATPSSSTRQMESPPTTTPITPKGTPYDVNLTAADGVVYAGANQTVYALHAGNGSLLWEQQTEGSILQVPLVVDGIVYVLTYRSSDSQGTLYALQASDGQQRWRFPLRTFSMPPAVEQGVVYLASPVDGLVALRASDGHQLWHAAPDIPSYETQVANGVLYVSAITANNRSTLYALRADNGSRLWRYSSQASGSPTIANGVVYQPEQGAFTALRASDGYRHWQRQVDGVSSMPTLQNGVLYLTVAKLSPGEEARAAPVTSNAASLLPVAALDVAWQGQSRAQQAFSQQLARMSVYALRVSDGTELWHFTLNNGNASLGGQITLAKQVVYVTSFVPELEGAIYALRSDTGKLIWQRTTDALPQSLLLANGKLFLGSQAEAVAALRASDGAQLWRYPIAGSVLNQPLLVVTVLYVGSNNGGVFALDPNAGKLLWYYQTGGA
jgi:outer membrane protein assembly factor BamB